MYKNIGGKIKTWARIVCIIGVVLSCLSGLILIAAGLMSAGMASQYSSAAAGTTVLVCVIGAVLIAGIGSLFSWLSTFLLYGFGQQVDMQEKSANSLEDIQMMMRHLISTQRPAAPKPAPAPAPAPVEPAPAEPVCPICGAKLTPDAAFCTNCGKKL